MSSSRQTRRVRVALALSLVALSLLRCAAPEQCLRGSDCDDGWACVSGTCTPANDTEATSPVRAVAEAGTTTTDAGKADATSSGDASSATKGDAAASPSDAASSD